MACDFLYNKTSIQNSFVHFTVSCKVRIASLVVSDIHLYSLLIINVQGKAENIRHCFKMNKKIFPLFITENIQLSSA